MPPAAAQQAHAAFSALAPTSSANRIVMLCTALNKRDTPTWPLWKWLQIKATKGVTDFVMLAITTHESFIARIDGSEYTFKPLKPGLRTVDRRLLKEFFEEWHRPGHTFFVYGGHGMGDYLDFETEKQMLQIHELAALLGNKQYLGMLFDACLMSNLDTAYYLRNNTRYIGAAEGYMWEEDTWHVNHMFNPYAASVMCRFRNAAKIFSLIQDEYVRKSQRADFAVIDTLHVEALFNKVYSDAMMKHIYSRIRLRPMSEVQAMERIAADNKAAEERGGGGSAVLVETVAAMPPSAAVHQSAEEGQAPVESKAAVTPTASAQAPAASPSAGGLGSLPSHGTAHSLTPALASTQPIGASTPHKVSGRATSIQSPAQRTANAPPVTLASQPGPLARVAGAPPNPTQPWKHGKQWASVAPAPLVAAKKVVASGGAPPSDDGLSDTMGTSTVGGIAAPTETLSLNRGEEGSAAGADDKAGPGSDAPESRSLLGITETTAATTSSQVMEGWDLVTNRNHYHLPCSLMPTELEDNHVVDLFALIRHDAEARDLYGRVVLRHLGPAETDLYALPVHGMNFTFGVFNASSRPLPLTLPAFDVAAWVARQRVAAGATCTAGERIVTSDRELPAVEGSHGADSVSSSNSPDQSSPESLT